MKLKDDLKKYLVDEIKYVINKMKETKDRRKKLYFFSAIHSAINRIYNLQYNSDLVFMHLVLNATHNSLIEVTNRQDNVLVIPEDFFDRLTNITENFCKEIEENTNTYNTLKEFSNLSYLASGNGNYLFQKGMLK